MGSFVRRIALSNLAPLGPEDTTFFSRLSVALREQGVATSLWTTARPDTDVAAKLILSSWRIDRWRELWPRVAAELPGGSALPEKDRIKWTTRLGRLVGQGAPGAEVAALLPLVEAVSQEVLGDPSVDRFCAWNPLCPHSGVAFDLAGLRRIPRTSMERGFFRDTWMLDEGGLMGDSVLTGRSLSDLLDGRDARYVDRGRLLLASQDWAAFDRYPQRPDRGPTSWPEAKRSGPRLAVFGSDDVSTGFIPTDHADRTRTRPGYASSFEAAVAVATARPDAAVAFKPHPSMSGHPTGEGPPNLLRLDVDYRELLGWCDAAVTVGSTLAFAVLAMDVPLISLARDVLWAKGIAHEALAAEAIGDAVALAVQGPPPDGPERYRAFVGWLATHYLVGLDPASGVDGRPEQLAGAIARGAPFLDP